MKKQNKNCMMFIKGKCNSNYRKNKPCNLDKCPYKFGGSFAMAVSDKKNWKKEKELNLGYSTDGTKITKLHCNLYDKGYDFGCKQEREKILNMILNYAQNVKKWDKIKELKEQIKVNNK